MAFAVAATRLLSGTIVCVLACSTPAVAPGAESSPHSVLYLDHNDPGEPFGVGMTAAFRSTMNAGSTEHIAIYAEHLDLIRSSGPRYEEVLKTYLREKYRDIPIGVIVGPGTAALTFMLPMRAEMWPQVPAIFVANPEAAAEAQIRPGVTGLVRRQPLRDSVSTTQALVPSVRRIALVGDVPRREYQRARFKEEIPSLAAGVEIIDLTGLRMVELRRRVAALPADTVIYFTTLTFDGDQPAFISRDALAAVSEVANSPIIVDLETHVGYGSVGGLVADPSAIGRALARLALRILGGESASNIPVVTGDFVRPIFDWRQLQRWGISERRLPPSSEIRFRQATAWEQYQWQIMLIAVALLLQTGLIIGLFQEHRRRRMAEVEARHRMAELAHMNRAATAGELSASIAHELNQPLTAITANSSAALRWLASATPNLNDARAALNSVVDEGHRASRLIGDIRAMYRKDDQQRAPLDVNELIRDVVALLQDQLKSREVEIQTELSPAIPQVSGNRVQLQQVILNLIMNAAEAMDAVTDRPRTLRIKTEREKDNGVLITLQDSGPGIDPESTDRIFNAFFTTKPNGMGMGLSICRSIVEAHDGRLWTSAGMDQGAVFHIALPLHHPQ